MKKVKKLLAILMASVMVAGTAAGCGTSSSNSTEAEKTQQSTEATAQTTASEETKANADEEKVDVYVFLAASLKNTMEKVKEDYESKYPNVNLIYNADSSGTLQKQIEEGARCDVFFSAATKQMDALNEGGYVLDGTIANLFMNKIVLIKPAGEETPVTGFDNITDASSLALAGEDVPVGQYARKLFTNMGILDKVMGMEINEGPNVTAVLTAVAEGSNEVGIVYATDAASMPDQVEVIAEADAKMVSPAVYPVGLIKDQEATEKEAEAAAEFKEYLSEDENVKEVFTNAGFAQYTE